MKLRTKIITAAAALSGAAVLGVGAIANTTSKVFAEGNTMVQCPNGYKTNLDWNISHTDIISTLSAIPDSQGTTAFNVTPSDVSSIVYSFDATNGYLFNKDGNGTYPSWKFGAGSDKGALTITLTKGIDAVGLYAVAYNNTKDAGKYLTINGLSAGALVAAQPYIEEDITERMFVELPETTNVISIAAKNSSNNRFHLYSVGFYSKSGFPDMEIPTSSESGTSTETSTEPEDTSTESSMEFAVTPGTNGSTCSVNGKSGVKVGTNKAGGNMSITVPTGATKLKFYAAAWKGVSGLSLNITGGTATPASLELTADDGISNNSPFTLVGNEDKYFFEIAVVGNTKYTLTGSSAKRFVVWGAEYYK